jgi:hypothetical protein
MARALRNITKKIAITATIIGIFGLGTFAQDADPPARVARLNYVNGNVSMEPAGSDDWAPAVINHPFTTGDYLYTDDGAQAELHMDVAAIRMAPQTSFGFLNLNDQIVQLKLSEGGMYIRVHNFGSGQMFEVDTPNAAVTLLRDGVYRFNVDPNGNTSFVVVRQGSAEVTGGGQAFTLNPGSSASLSGTDQLSYDVENAPPLDQFDTWCQQRDQHEMRPRPAHVPPSVIGYEDLDDYGSWSTAPDYGPVWYPTTVAAGWAPYHYGHWAWVEPWGYTWVDAAPWGFAPFHYGRWAYVGNRWGWCPGPIAVGYRGPAVAVARPYYAPALVTFFGGAHFGNGISVGVNIGIGSVGGGLGWCPLGFGEVYAPPYRVSPRYFQNVNVANTRIDRTVNITNIYNTTYVNRTVNNTVINNRYVNMNAPGGFSAMNRAAFANGTQVNRGGVIVPPAQAERLARTGAPVYGPPVAPTRQALAPGAGGGRIARPPSQVMARQVVARNTPPPSAPSFAARQSYLQQHAGQPLNVQAMHQEAARANPSAVSRQAAFVRQAPPVARPVQAQIGQRVGNPVPFHTAQQPFQNSRVAPNQPGVNQPGANHSGANQPGPNQPRPNQPGPNQVSPNQAGHPAVAQQPHVQHGVPPNQRQANAPQPAQASRPGGFTPNHEQQTPSVRPTPNAQAQPQQRAPSQHGLPPNQRQAHQRQTIEHPQTPPHAPAAHPQGEERRPQAQHLEQRPQQTQRPAQEPHSQPRPAAEPRPAHEAHGAPPNRPQNEEHRPPARGEHEKESK